jgi:3-hydroxyisobutyrate dehydrogenase-like beta-hydroxyacid dehydrogenase
VSPATAGRIAAVVEGAGAGFVDAGIIGGPPGLGTPGPRLYASGAQARRLAALAEKGLDVRVLDGPVGAASALKMAYGGITKGTIGLVAAIMLGATRAGAAEALRQELAESRAPFLAEMTRTVPGMYGKAYRWVAEMEEIAGFLAEDPAAAKVYEGMAELYTRLAADAAGPRREIEALDAFLAARD